MRILPTLEPHSFHALITDPPYASGGNYRSDRLNSTSTKYLSSDSNSVYKQFDFEGDQMDQRTWMIYTTDWLKTCRTLVLKGGVFAVFIDWRQLAAMIDCLSFAGWIVRGIVPWDKINARPQPGRFRQQSEFVVWGSNGAMSLGRDAPFLTGVLRCPTVNSKKRKHQTEKPLELMRQVVQICERGGRILDPFAGSGTTLVAAEAEGFSALGIEITDYYAAVAEQRKDTEKL